MMLEQEGGQPDDVQEKLTPGKMLQRAREAKKISLTDAANELRLSNARLSDLEENRFSEMGAVTFAKGYLRSYARFLGVSEEEVLQAFDEFSMGSDIPIHKPRLIHEKMTETGSKSPRRFGYLLLLVIAVLAAFWWHNREAISQSVLELTSSISGDAEEQAVDDTTYSGGVSNYEQDTDQETYNLPVEGMSLIQAPAETDEGATHNTQGGIPTNDEFSAQNQY